MAQNRQYLIHLNSGAQGAKPKPEDINYGELAVNYNENTPFVK